MAKKMVIAGSTVSAQQLKDLFRQIADGGITSLHMQAFLERRNPFEVSPATFLTANYFVTRPGLWVSDNFVSQITVAYSKPLVPQGLDGVGSFDLKQESSGMSILAHSEMGGEENVRKYAFTPDQIAALIDMQPGGTAGLLLNFGFANLFYMVGVSCMLFVVDLSWNTDDREWDVRVFKFDEPGEWDPDSRVFYNTRTF